MAADTPFSLDALDPETRAIAERSAKAAGLSVEEWVARAILRRTGVKLAISQTQVARTTPTGAGSAEAVPGATAPATTPRSTEETPSVVRSFDFGFRPPPPAPEAPPAIRTPSVIDVPEPTVKTPDIASEQSEAVAPAPPASPAPIKEPGAPVAPSEAEPAPFVGEEPDPSAAEPMKMRPSPRGDDGTGQAPSSESPAVETKPEAGPAYTPPAALSDRELLAALSALAAKVGHTPTSGVSPTPSAPGSGSMAAPHAMEASAHAEEEEHAADAVVDEAAESSTTPPAEILEPTAETPPPAYAEVEIVSAAPDRRSALPQKDLEELKRALERISGRPAAIPLDGAVVVPLGVSEGEAAALPAPAANESGSAPLELTELLPAEPSERPAFPSMEDARAAAPIDLPASSRSLRGLAVAIGVVAATGIAGWFYVWSHPNENLGKIAGAAINKVAALWPSAKQPSPTNAPLPSDAASAPSSAAPTQPSKTEEAPAPSGASGAAGKEASTPPSAAATPAREPEAASPAAPPTPASPDTAAASAPAASMTAPTSAAAPSAPASSASTPSSPPLAASEPASPPPTQSAALPSKESAAAGPKRQVKPPEASTRPLPVNIKELEALAKKGDPRAQHDLGTLYARGDQVPQDYAKAAYWFRESALQGIAGAQYNLGVLYEQGLGVEKDPLEALLWYLSAAEQRHPAAEYNVGIAYAEGKGIPQNYIEARKWFTRAAEAGLGRADFNLGVLNELGLGGPGDLIEAYKWFKLAVRGGEADAEKRLAAVGQKMKPEQIAEADRRYDTSAAVMPAKPVYPADRAATSPVQRPAASQASSATRIPAATSAAPGGATPALPKSESTMTVAEIQRLLDALGYEPGLPDGQTGPKTVAAIRAFQREAGLPVDGQATPQLLDYMRKLSGKK